MRSSKKHWHGGKICLFSIWKVVQVLVDSVEGPDIAEDLKSEKGQHLTQWRRQAMLKS